MFPWFVLWFWKQCTDECRRTLVLSVGAGDRGLGFALCYSVAIWFLYVCTYVHMFVCCKGWENHDFCLVEFLSLLSASSFHFISTTHILGCIKTTRDCSWGEAGAAFGEFSAISIPISYTG